MNSQEIIDNLLDEAIQQFVDFGDYCQSFIVEEKRDYPRTTIRKEGVGVTGKIAESPRDVVDTGDLRESYNVEVEKTTQTAVVDIVWDAPHASLVYFGREGVPPYPWVDMALRRYEF